MMKNTKTNLEFHRLIMNMDLEDTERFVEAPTRWMKVNRLYEEMEDMKERFPEEALIIKNFLDGAIYGM